MAKPLTQIKLPTDRVEQLREVALGIHGIQKATFSDALGMLLKIAREQGIVAHGIPSVELRAASDGLTIRFDEGELVGFSFAEAQMIADGIRQCLAGQNNGAKIEESGLSAGGSFSVHGRGGNAIAVAIPIAASPKMFTRDLAAEFADLLEHEIAKKAK